VVALAHHLAAELRRWGRTDMLLPMGEAGFAPMLDRALAGNDQLVLPAVPDTPWADFCLAQADRILVIGSRAAGASRPHPPELRGCDLLTWDVPPGSGALAEWATALQPVETHAVRGASVGADVARLARRLAGRSVGIVLSGGGARAFAHLGVLDELHASGVVVDRVGGTSMGAFIGALYAMGLDPAEIDARCHDEWVRRRPLRDVVIPRHALIRGDRVRAMLARTFGDVAIEELPRGLYTAATDLRRGELVVTRSGKVAEAVGPSMAIPVLAPATVRDGRMLVDGSLTDNLPVATMAALGEGPIIAVDCKASIPRRPRGHAPSLGAAFSRVVTLASANTTRSARQHADLTITPRDPGIGLLEFSQIDAAKEAGREAARRALGASPLRAAA
jgi:predicted acylesterase/phospholipase RssA